MSQAHVTAVQERPAKLHPAVNFAIDVGFAAAVGYGLGAALGETGAAQVLANSALVLAGIRVGPAIGAAAVSVAKESVAKVKDFFSRNQGLDARAFLERMPLASAAAKCDLDAAGNKVYFIREAGRQDFQQVDNAGFAKFKQSMLLSKEPLLSVNVTAEGMEIATFRSGKLHSVGGADGQLFPAVLVISNGRDGMKVDKAAYFEAAEDITAKVKADREAAPVGPGMR